MNSETIFGDAHCGFAPDVGRLELKPFGIDVIVVAPGGIKSNLEGNAQQVYDTLPRWKFYQPWEKFIRLRMGYSQQRGATTAKEFAKRTVAAVLKKKPPAYFITGHLSYVVTSLSYLPLFLRDFIFSKMFGLRVHLSSGKSA
jgi:short-subunit dehydrogenase